MFIQIKAIINIGNVTGANKKNKIPIIFINRDFLLQISNRYINAINIIIYAETI